MHGGMVARKAKRVTRSELIAWATAKGWTKDRFGSLHMKNQRIKPGKDDVRLELRTSSGWALFYNGKYKYLFISPDGSILAKTWVAVATCRVCLIAYKFSSDTPRPKMKLIRDGGWRTPRTDYFGIIYATCPECQTKKGVDEGRPAEGIVARPIETLFDKRMERIIIKLKTKDFVPGRR